MEAKRIRIAVEIMDGYAARDERYLWTDAFAVCNDLGLARVTGKEQFRDRALARIERVHATLAHTRDGHWLRGSHGAAGPEHPTRAGVRIGKKLPERGPDEPLDERLEWDRDGQYFHYLTRWMHALDLAARATGRETYNRWARELAETAAAAFVYRPTGAPAPRMYWKMSVDLSRPLVSSMGHHDPLDGLITYAQLGVTARQLEADAKPALTDETARFAAMLRGPLTTSDPLGLGSLLHDAYRVHQLMPRGAFTDGELLEALLAAASTGLRGYAAGSELDGPAAARLAFRELGLAIGLHALERLIAEVERDPDRYAKRPAILAHLQTLKRYLPLRHRIERFWLRPESRRADTWTEHRDINEVMLATALVPDGCLELPTI